MARADRAFGALVVIAVALTGWIALPLTLTLFPALVARIVRSSGDMLFFCSGVIATVHTELPPFGMVALGLVAVAVAPASLRAAHLLRSARTELRHVEVDAPPRLRNAASRVGIADRVTCVDDGARYAYCAGSLRPRIVVSIGAVRALRPRELEAVLWHEAHHLRRRDPLRALVARGLAALFIAAPVVGELAARFEVAKELDADSAALRAQGAPDGLAGALLILDRAVRSPGRPAVSAWSLSSIRVDQLAGAREERLLPSVSTRAIALTTLALLSAFVIALGQAARVHLLALGFLPEAAGAFVHACPLPIGGPLL